MHTKGPWKYQRDGRSDAMMGKPGWDPNDRSQCGHNVYGLSTRIAHLPDPMDCEEATIANDRLIAAAPELLEACKHALANLRPAGKVTKDFSGHNAIEALGKAIAPAEGAIQ